MLLGIVGVSVAFVGIAFLVYRLHDAELGLKEESQ